MVPLWWAVVVHASDGACGSTSKQQFMAGTEPMTIFPRCNAQFNAPCSTNWVYWMVHDIVAALDNGTAVDVVLSDVNAKAYNRDFNFWPELVSSGGRFVASGAPDTVAPREGHTFDEVMSNESYISQEGLWSYLTKEGDALYRMFVGRDGYHDAPVRRVAYLLFTCRDDFVWGPGDEDRGRLAVLASYSDEPFDFVEQSCNATADELCSVRYSARVNGEVTTKLLLAEDSNSLRMVLHEITDGAYNFNEKDAPPCTREDPGCFYPVVFDDSGVIMAHGAMPEHIGEVIIDRPGYAAAFGRWKKTASDGGGFTFYEAGPHELSGNESLLQFNSSIGLLTGVTHFNETYYIGVSFNHALGTNRNGPYCRPCLANESFACGWQNARVLLGHLQAMLLASTIDDETSFDEAWARVSSDDNYAISTTGPGTKDFYAFAYDFNGTCVAHGLFESFTGNTGLENFGQFFNNDAEAVESLHQQWINASMTDASWAIRYKWPRYPEREDPELFDKVVYVIQIARNGRNYYVAVGIGEAEPPLPSFASSANGYYSAEYASYETEFVAEVTMGAVEFLLATAGNHTEYNQALDVVRDLRRPTYDDLRSWDYSDVELGRWWNDTLHPFAVFAWSQVLDQIVVWGPEPAWEGLSLADFSERAGIDELSFSGLAEGFWKDGLVDFRKQSGAASGQHFLFYNVIDIADEIYDDVKNGISDSLHLAIFVRDEYAPRSNAFERCDLITAVPDDFAIPGDQCACQYGGTPVFEDRANITGDCFEERRGTLAASLLTRYDMMCDFVCPAGQYKNSDGNCQLCEAGRFRTEGDDSSCTACEPGRFSASEGAIVCTTCSFVEWQDQYNATDCNACPLNTQRVFTNEVQELGTKQSDCLCFAGTCDNYPCKLSRDVEELYASLNESLPYTYVVSNESDLTLPNLPRAGTGAYLPGYSTESGGACKTCPTGGICLGGTDVPFPDEGYSEANHYKVTRETMQTKWKNTLTFKECDGDRNGQDWCRTNFTCGDGRRSNRLMCWSIQKKRVELVGTEYACPSGDEARWIFTAMLFAGVFVVFLFLNVIMGSFPAMDIFLNNARSMSIIKDFNISWPRNARSAAKSGLTRGLDYWFTLLDVSQIDIEVVQPTCVWQERFLTHALTQWCVLLLELAWYFGSAAVRCVRAKTTDERRHYYSTAIGQSLSALTMMYPTLCEVGFRAFMCQEFNNNRSYLLADLNVRCWHSVAHKQLLLICSLLVAIVIAYPVIVAAILQQLQDDKRMHSSEALERYGLFYVGFKPENYQWSVLQIVKALMLSVIQVLLSKRPALQIFSSLMVLIFSVAMQFYYNPFLHRKSDILEAFLLFATSATVGIAAAFELVEAENRGQTTVELTLVILLHLIYLGALVFSLLCVFHNMRERKFVEESRTKLVDLVNFARFELAQPCDSDVAEDDLDGDVKPIKRYQPREIHDTLKPDALVLWVRQVSKVVEKARENSNEAQLLRDIGDIDETFSPALSDIGIASIFSNSEEALFWRRVDVAMPDLLEFMAVASTTDIVQLKVLIGKLLAARVHSTTCGPGEHRVGYRDLVTKEDRGALLRALLIADETNRQKFFGILDALASTVKEMPDPRYLRAQHAKVPVGYERNSGQSLSKSIKRAIFMTSRYHSPSQMSTGSADDQYDDIVARTQSTRTQSTISSRTATPASSSSQNPVTRDRPTLDRTDSTLEAGFFADDRDTIAADRSTAHSADDMKYSEEDDVATTERRSSERPRSVTFAVSARDVSSVDVVSDRSTNESLPTAEIAQPTAEVARPISARTVAMSSSFGV